MQCYAATLIPDPDSPLSWDRFAGMMNNPVRYTDPTGHKVVNDFTGGDGLEKRQRNNPPITISIDIQKMAQDVLGSMNEFAPVGVNDLNNFATQAYHVALAADGIVESIVLGYAGAGLAGGITFEGNPVTGAAGGGAG